VLFRSTQSFTPQAETSTLVSHILEAPCLVRGKAEPLARIVHILLDNAYKFSEAEKPIFLQLRKTNGNVVLSVTDQGCGFAPEMGAELFRPFTIANVMNHTQGTGLSLALASAISTTYGGKIQARSAGPGQGATFTVELPEVSLL
jgi:signal transduction histidine kinase